MRKGIDLGALCWTYSTKGYSDPQQTDNTVLQKQKKPQEKHAENSTSKWS